MKVHSPNIAWILSKQPSRILSIDFNPFDPYEMALGGTEVLQKNLLADKQEMTEGCIKIYRIFSDNLEKPQFMYGIPEAKATVNVVKYSPDGRYLASGSDGNTVTIWTKRMANKSFSDSEKTLRWARPILLSGHTKDVIDLCWTKDSKHLVSCGMDGRTILHNVEAQYSRFSTGQIGKLVQGVAIDPLCRYYISVQNNQMAKVYIKIKSSDKKQSEKTPLSFNTYTLKKFVHRTEKEGTENMEDENEDDSSGNSDPNFSGQKDFKFTMFANESISTFFRRPAISPDGELFLMPCGVWKNAPGEPPICCSYMFRRNYYEKPSFVVQSKGEPALICKFCPKLYKKKNPEEGLFEQKYFMIFAIATTNSVIVYSTEDMKPLHGFGNYHYAALTDLAWREDELLAVSSSDGFISFLTFEKGIFGEEYIPDEGSVLKQLVTKIQYVPPQKKEKLNGENKVVEEQKTEIRMDAQGRAKKRIIPKKVDELEE